VINFGDERVIAGAGEDRPFAAAPDLLAQFVSSTRAVINRKHRILQFWILDFGLRKPNDKLQISNYKNQKPKTKKQNLKSKTNFKIDNQPQISKPETNFKTDNSLQSPKPGNRFEI
jgi:hypothetical protein